MMEKRSIIPGLVVLLMLVHLRHARQFIYEDDSTALQPIVSLSRRTRICAELCLSGLGGSPCGNTCYDLMPSNLPITQQKDRNSDGSYNITILSERTGRHYNVSTREGSCEVLCRNGLGYPLCNCNYGSVDRYDIDFLQVCSIFCVNYDYQVYGCQNCSLYKNISQSDNDQFHLPIISGHNSSFIANADNNQSLRKQDSNTVLTIEWNIWCLEVCSDGNGGAACNCDLLP